MKKLLEELKIVKAILDLCICVCVGFPGRLQSMGSQRLGHDWVTYTHTHTHTHTHTRVGLPGGSVVKNPPASVADTDSIPGSGRSPGGGHGNPHQHFCLENLMDRGA